MTTGNVRHWWRDGKKIVADESNNKPFFCSDADEVWGDVHPNDLYNSAPTQEEVLGMEVERREGIKNYGEDWRQKAVAVFMEAANNARDKDGKFPRRDKRERRKMRCSDIDIPLPPAKNLSEENGKSTTCLQDNDIMFDNNDGDGASLAMSSLGDDSVSPNDKIKSRKNVPAVCYCSDDKVESDVHDSFSVLQENASPPGSDSPSNDIGKSVDTEGVVQGLLYPGVDSSGATVTPPKVDSLVSGKRKSGKSRNRKKSKKVKSNNHNVKGGCRVVKYVGDSPSDDIGKSADSEVVEGSLYPDDGAVVPPTKIEVLAGGKRKGRRARTKTRNKKNKSHHGMVHGGCRVISTPSLKNELEQ